MPHDTRAEVWRIRIHRREDAVDCTLLLLTPVPAARQVVGEMLTEKRGHVGSLRRQGLIERRWNQYFHDGFAREAFQPRRGIRVIHVFQRWREDDSRTQVR